MNPFFLSSQFQMWATIPWVLAALITAACIFRFAVKKADDASRLGAVGLGIFFLLLALFEVATVYYYNEHRFDLIMLLKAVFAALVFFAAIAQIWVQPFVPDLRAAKMIEDKNKELELKNAELKKELDNAVETVQLRGSLLASLIHELRVPLQAMIGMNELMLDSKLDKQQQLLSDGMRDSTHSMMSLVLDIQELTRLEIGKPELELSAFHVRDVLRDAISFCTDVAREKRLFINTEVDTSIDSRVLGDQWALKQTLIHLVRNGLRSTARGGIVVRIYTEKEAPTSATLCFAVSDTGHGLTEEEQASLFDPVKRDSAGRAHELADAGLDLYISTLLVQLMGATMSVSSKKGEGTTISFSANFQLAETRSPGSSGSRMKVIDSTKEETSV